MLIDLCYAIDELKGIGTDNSEMLRKYEILKSIEEEVEERHENGDISEEKYLSYRKSLEEIEERING